MVRITETTFAPMEQLTRYNVYDFMFQELRLADMVFELLAKFNFPALEHGSTHARKEMFHEFFYYCPFYYVRVKTKPENGRPNYKLYLVLDTEERSKND